jgi:hypothetical protein
MLGCMYILTQWLAGEQFTAVAISKNLQGLLHDLTRAVLWASRNSSYYLQDIFRV